jgi:hypothetical protein
LKVNVSKPVSEIKLPSNVVSDTALGSLAAKLHTGETFLEAADAVSCNCLNAGVSLSRKRVAEIGIGSHTPKRFFFYDLKLAGRG